VISPEQNREGKRMLLRIVSMLTKLGRHKHELREEPDNYANKDSEETDPDWGGVGVTE